MHTLTCPASLIHTQFSCTSNPHNKTAQHAVKTFAAALAARFNPVVGCTRSWDTADPTDFQVIIDNMMNLEVLFNAADLTGNDTLRQIAISHADKTMMNHIRADGAPPRNLTPLYPLPSLQHLYRVVVPCRRVQFHDWCCHRAAHSARLLQLEHLEPRSSMGHLWLRQQ
jgi:hypothetical protein